MAEATQYLFSFKELAELMIKKQDIHDGLWAIYVKFGISAANISLSGAEFQPTALVPVVELGIQKMDQQTPLTVNAAEVNQPATKVKKEVVKKV